VTATERPQRLIDDFTRGWQDWYRLNAGNAHHWSYATRKIVDPSWMGPRNGKLAFEIETTEGGNQLAVGVEVNSWQSYTGRKKDTYYAVVPLTEVGRQPIELQAADFKNKQGSPLADWDEAVELVFKPANRIGGPMAGDQNWNGRPPSLANLRWEGGTLIPRPHPHQPRGTVNTQGRPSFEDEFQSAIEDSVERERLDQEESRKPAE